jgi:hypothetical protein
MSGFVRLKPARRLFADERVRRFVPARYWYLLAVEAVICEPVSASLFPVRRENTGKFANSDAIGSAAAPFLHANQWLGPHFPEHENREIFSENRELFVPKREPLPLPRVDVLSAPGPELKPSSGGR